MPPVAVAPVYLSCTIEKVNGPLPVQVTVDEANQEVTMDIPASQYSPAAQAFRAPATFSAKSVTFGRELYGNKTVYTISRVHLSLTEQMPLGVVNQGKCTIQKLEHRAF